MVAGRKSTVVAQHYEESYHHQLLHLFLLVSSIPSSTPVLEPNEEFWKLLTTHIAWQHCGQFLHLSLLPFHLFSSCEGCQRNFFRRQNYSIGSQLK